MDQRDRSNRLSDVNQASSGVCLISLNDSKILESAQKRATLTKESHHLPYEERLKTLGLTKKTRNVRVHSHLQTVARY